MARAERRRHAMLAGLSVLLLAGACAGPPQAEPPASTVLPDAPPGASPSPMPATTTPAAPAAPPAAPPPAAPAPDQVAVRLVSVADLDAPTALAVRPGDDALYIAERGGRVRVVRAGAVEPRALLDISGQTTTDGERGLLGLTFSPSGDRLYLSHTDASGDSRLAEYTVSGGRVDPGSRRELLFQEQPFANHNGGDITFGPDGMLYLGLGDGGSGGDPMDNAQSLDSLLGKLLRIDPLRGDPYAIPPDNPFAGGGGRPEIWAYGLRNPWRFSFDRATGDLWIADVGQRAREEVDFAPAGTGAGANYGWNRLEGTRPYEGQAPADAVPPIFEYPRTSQRCTIIGGYVYRGTAIPGLRGAYLYADLCDGRIRALVQDGGRVVADADLGVSLPRIVSFGEGPDGELYALSLRGEVARIAPG